MKIAIFDEKDYTSAGQYLIDENNMVWLHGTLLAKRLGFANPSKAIVMHTDDDERKKEEIDGRLVWFVSEPGIWGMILAAKTPEAKAFKRKLKHDILPKLHSRGFVTVKMQNETLAEYQARNEELEKINERHLREIDSLWGDIRRINAENKVLTHKNNYIMENYAYKAVISQFMMINIRKLPDGMKRIRPVDGAEMPLSIDLIISRWKKWCAHKGYSLHMNVTKMVPELRDYLDSKGYEYRINDFGDLYGYELTDFEKAKKFSMNVDLFLN